MRFIFCFLLLLSSTILTAQVAVSADLIGGTPLSGAAYSEFKGSPYLSEDFEKGEVIFASGKRYENMELKYDQILKKLIFKDKDGEGKYFKDHITSFTVKRADGVHYYERALEGDFLESLVKGSKPLWKGTLKSIVEDRPYGTTKVQKIINTSFIYYSQDATGLVKFKNDKKGLSAIFSDKIAEVEAFIKEHKLNPKSEQDLVSVFNYYNSIK